LIGDILLLAKLLPLIVSLCLLAGESYALSPVKLSDSSQRAFRLGFMKLSPEIDARKPLAAQNRAGWVIVEDTLIGQIDHEWIAGYSLSQRRFVWWKSAETGLTAPLIALGSSIILGFRDGNVQKIDAETGRVAWTSRLDSYVGRTPVLSGSTLLLMSVRQQLHALNFQSGETQWSYDAGSPSSLVVRSGVAPVVHLERVYLGTNQGEIHALSLNTGSLHWRVNPEFLDARFHEVVGQLVIHANNLIVTRYDGLVAAIDLDRPESRIAWQDQLGTITTSTYRNGRLYIGNLNGDIHAYDALNGRRVWRAATGASVSHLLATETQVIAAATAGQVSALQVEDGHLLWLDHLHGDLSARPLNYEDQLYFITGANNLYAYRAN